jgi:uncharacterized repeat protein (TIGR03843 family)
VYKPLAGERELWDFPSGTLGRREVAAYALDSALNWGLIPTTVWRSEGPFGPGMCQQWIEGEPDLVALTTASDVPSGWREVLRGQDSAGTPVTLSHANRPDVQRLAVFDVIANNADRKGGHILRDAHDHLWAIDHGVTFATDFKLRTVLWGWLDDPIPTVELADLAALTEKGGVATILEPWLTPTEIEATQERIADLVETGTFPQPSADWPAVPWPVM